MDNFKYKVSVIVPVYNVSEYLRDCLDSLLAQTIDQNQMEVLLINDGSTDNSLDICYEYAQSHFIFKVFSQENQGVSAARNVGLNNAEGKYIMFLDSDDTYTAETIKLVTSFFDKHYDEIDMTAYYDQYYYNGTPLPPHDRYKFLKTTGIYDLEDTIYAMQVRLNICIKNKFKDNLLFDTEMGYQEDQKYCCKILSEKLKLGYVKEAQYNYLKNSDGIVATSTNVLEIYDKSIKFFEDIFNSYKDVPRYYQALFIHDCGWKLKQNCLFPYQYEKGDFEREYNRIISLLKKVDIDVIMNAPTVDNFHKYYFVDLAHKKEITIYSDVQGLMVLSEQKILRSEKKCEIIVQKMKYNDGKLLMLAMFKSVYGNFIDDCHIFVRENINNEEKMIKLEKFISSDSYYKSRECTNKFWGFYYQCDMNSVNSFDFFVEIDGMMYPTRFYFMPNTMFFKKAERNCAALGLYKLSINDESFFIDRINESERLSIIRENTYPKYNDKAKMIRAESEKFYGRRIWLYYDCKGVKGDNGYYQFEHDVSINDGIERYYISNNGYWFDKEYISDDLYCKVVKFGSVKHKLMYVNAEKILTAFVEPYNYNPFYGMPNEECQYTDIIHYQLVYLQHGILHAHLPWKYTPERCLADKVVVSSYFEQKNFSENYNFRIEDIIMSGMGRFDKINTESMSASNEHHILFAPTWRQYLISQDTDGSWIPLEKKFINSSYYKNFNEFFNDSELMEILEQNNVYIDVKLHPIFLNAYTQLFNSSSEHIRFISNTDEEIKYVAFITDFSSYVFDFAYSKTPIIYFVPDYLEFKAGLNQYRMLDLPFEKAFGPLVTEEKDAVNEIRRLINSDFIPEQIFKNRMDDFYLPMKDCCGKIYDALTEKL